MERWKEKESGERKRADREKKKEVEIKENRTIKEKFP